MGFLFFLFALSPPLFASPHPWKVVSKTIVQLGRVELQVGRGVLYRCDQKKLSPLHEQLSKTWCYFAVQTAQEAIQKARQHSDLDAWPDLHLPTANAKAPVSSAAGLKSCSSSYRGHESYRWGLYVYTLLLPSHMSNSG